MWRGLGEVLGATVVDVNVKEVTQADGRQRFDVFVPANRSDEFVRALNRNNYNWRIKLHVKYKERVHRVLRGRGLATVPAFKCASWNMRHYSAHFDTLKEYIQDCNIDVISLQETYRKIYSEPMRLPNFKVFESPSLEGTGKNGLAICVNAKFKSHEVTGTSSPYCMAVCVRVLDEKFFIVNVYIPTGVSSAYRAGKQALCNLLTRLRSDPRTPFPKILVMGDFNKDIATVQGIIHNEQLDLSLVQYRGSPYSYFRKETRSILDHFAVSQSCIRHVYKYAVKKYSVQSDHYPIECIVFTTYNAPQVGGGVVVPANVPVIKSYNRTIITNRRDTIANSDVWLPFQALYLAEEGGDEDGVAAPEEEDIDALYSRFSDTAHTLLQGVGAVSVKRVRKCKFRMSARAKRLVMRRKRFYLRWERSRDDEDWEDYLEVARLAKDATRQSKWECIQRNLLEGKRLSDEGDNKGYWRWLKGLLGRNNDSCDALGPLRYVAEDGITRDAISDPDVLKVVHDHYKGLFGIDVLHSKDRAYWAEQFPGPARDPLPGLSERVSWRELNSVIKRLKNGKAAGIDGFPPEFFKLAYEIDSADQPVGELPATPFGYTLLYMVNSIMRKGVGQQVLNTSVITSIFKDGVPTEMDNYRGISLIPIIVKLVTATLVDRISSALEDVKFFSKS